MSKESALASECPGCDMRIFFVEQHIPHCKNYPAHIATHVRRAAVLDNAPRIDKLVKDARY